VVEARSPYVDAALYDVIYSWYAADTEFYVERAKRANGPVLEIGCGTGRVLIPTLQAGVDADGLDLAPDMLERLAAKAAALGLHPRLVEGDMRDFTMPRRYALATIPFRSFQHLLTTEDQIGALRCIREHLELGGALVFNVFYPSLRTVQEYQGQQRLEREIAHPETGLPVALYATTHYDQVGQQLTAEREVIESDARGYAAKTHRMGFAMRWTYRYEMELLLRTAGYSRWEVCGGFDGRPLEKDADEMVWTAWKD
jgi:SAM-dependent methyltransferase